MWRRTVTARSFAIAPLDDCPDHLDTVVQWVWDEWRGGHNKQSFEETRSIIQGKPDRPPTLVAIDEHTAAAVGVLGFRRVMLHGREPLLLFINSLFVPAPARRRGVATALVAEAVRRVGARSGPSDEWLYVYTNIASWYEARGFDVAEHDAETGNTVLRMQIARRAA
jgi:ribosomal protein S18 acetylase RimI-like enzyme